MTLAQTNGLETHLAKIFGLPFRQRAKHLVSPARYRPLIPIR